ncbi:jg14917 [Pararge aegeria aegeria]|uniref:Jg14917 protein n=1 Tax=Pararge aegeria aegeria TaxID=348720 RepID=A0A8S4QI30_9NEOP|nr:jg14917 [Pararge aegeria aegeria]
MLVVGCLISKVLEWRPRETPSSKMDDIKRVTGSGMRKAEDRVWWRILEIPMPTVDSMLNDDHDSSSTSCSGLSPYLVGRNLPLYVVLLVRLPVGLLQFCHDCWLF